MTKASDSRRKPAEGEDFATAVDRLRREAGPALAKALDLDRAEAVEAAMNAVAELAMAAREIVRAIPMPPKAREHVENAEREAVRAAKLAVKSIDKQARKRTHGAPLQAVPVEFKKAAGKKRPRGRRSIKR